MANLASAPAGLDTGASAALLWAGTTLLAAVTAAMPAVAQSAIGRATPNGSAPQSVTREAVEGVWLDDTGQGAIELNTCGTRLCGRIVWLKAPNDDTGRPLTDGYNPEPARRRRPICGLQVLGDLKRMGGGRWDQGWIYDPKVGKSYDVEVMPAGPDRLKITGYLGVRWLSESFIWTRAPAELKLCTNS